MRTTCSIVRGFNVSVLLWLLMWALAAFGYFGLQGVLFNLYLLRLGFGPEFIGLLVGSGQLVWAVAALPSAAVSRRVGRGRRPGACPRRPGRARCHPRRSVAP